MTLSQPQACPPVLFCVFNRPDVTAQSFHQIRKAQPKSLFIAADGPRPDRPQEAELCEQVRRIATAVDWSCDVRTRFQDQNIGCAKAVSTAISWFFEDVDAGIILEDDCVPDPTFFDFCTLMLGRYAHHERIGAVTGNNFQDGQIRNPDGYYFSKYNHVWGWATWRRAWKLFDFEMSVETGDSLSTIVSSFPCSPGERAYWLRIFENVQRGRIDTWDYRWTYSLWKHGLLTVTPNVNLVENIGFGKDATHTVQASPRRLHAGSLTLSTSAISNVDQCVEADNYAAKHHFQVPNNRLQLTVSEVIRFINRMRN